MKDSAYVLCPWCVSDVHVRRSRHRAKDIFWRLLRRRPYRCQACGGRFYSGKHLAGRLTIQGER